MAFAPVPKRPVSEVVFEQLRTAILAGRYAAGDPLPSERLLSEEFAVNRHAVREAMKRLQQAGLVAVNHGGATRVLDWRRTGGMDLLPHLAFVLDGPGAAERLRSILEMRRSIGVDVSRLAARRATAEAVARLRAFAADDARPTDDPHVLGDRYEELWRTLVAASDNLAYTLAYNSLLSGTAEVAELAHHVFHDEASDLAAQAALVDAIAAGDADLAAARADALLSRTLVTVLGATGEARIDA
jgi:GntR family transcriptional regulator, transcriptional repressor for pyruvate dehydrogenase complex